MSKQEVGHSLDPILDPKHSSDDNPNLVLEFQKCKAQIGTKFGCIPLTPIYVYKGRPRIWDPIPDVLPGVPIFFGYRVPVQTNLNVTGWRKHLVDFFDHAMLGPLDT